MKRAIVTGGAGFIGSYLTKRLLETGVEVLSVDNYSNVPDQRLRYFSPVKGFAVKRLDVLDSKAFGAALDQFGAFDTFFDLAYINGTKQFYTRAHEILAHAGTHVQQSLHWVQSRKARWVYFSTPEIYGEPGVVPTPEDHRVLMSDLKNPRFSYAIGKVFSESFIHAARLADPSLNAVIVRPNNTYGPTDRFHVIADLMEKVFRGEPLEIQGSGDETRSFCYVEDMVDQILLVAEKGKPGEVYSMGSEEEVTIKDLVSKLQSATGVAAKVSYGPLSAGSPKRRRPDLSRIRSLGASPARSVADGLALTWKIEKELRDGK